MLIQHSKYSAILSTPADCFFGDFAHWDRSTYSRFAIYTVTTEGRDYSCDRMY